MKIFLVIVLWVTPALLQTLRPPLPQTVLSPPPAPPPPPRPLQLWNSSPAKIDGNDPNKNKPTEKTLTLTGSDTVDIQKLLEIVENNLAVKSGVEDSEAQQTSDSKFVNGDKWNSNSNSEQLAFNNVWVNIKDFHPDNNRILDSNSDESKWRSTGDQTPSANNGWKGSGTTSTKGSEWVNTGGSGSQWNSGSSSSVGWNQQGSPPSKKVNNDEWQQGKWVISNNNGSPTGPSTGWSAGSGSNNQNSDGWVEKGVTTNDWASNSVEGSSNSGWSSTPTGPSSSSHGSTNGNKWVSTGGDGASAWDSSSTQTQTAGSSKFSTGPWESRSNPSGGSPNTWNQDSTGTKNDNGWTGSVSTSSSGQNGQWPSNLDSGSANNGWSSSASSSKKGQRGNSNQWTEDDFGSPAEVWGQQDTRQSSNSGTPSGSGWSSTVGSSKGGFNAAGQREVAGGGDWNSQVFSSRPSNGWSSEDGSWEDEEDEDESDWNEDGQGGWREDSQSRNKPGRRPDFAWDDGSVPASGSWQGSSKRGNRWRQGSGQRRPKSRGSWNRGRSQGWDRDSHSQNSNNNNPGGNSDSGRINGNNPPLGSNNFTSNPQALNQNQPRGVDPPNNANSLPSSRQIQYGPSTANNALPSNPAPAGQIGQVNPNSGALSQAPYANAQGNFNNAAQAGHVHNPPSNNANFAPLGRAHNFPKQQNNIQNPPRNHQNNFQNNIPPNGNNIQGSQFQSNNGPNGNNNVHPGQNIPASSNNSPPVRIPLPPGAWNVTIINPGLNNSSLPSRTELIVQADQNGGTQVISSTQTPFIFQPQVPIPQIPVGSSGQQQNNFPVPFQSDRQVPLNLQNGYPQSFVPDFPFEPPRQQFRRRRRVSIQQFRRRRRVSMMERFHRFMHRLLG